MKRFFRFVMILFFAFCLAFLTFVLVFRGDDIMAYVQEEIALAQWEAEPSGSVREATAYWTLDETGWQYIDETGTAVADQWMTIDGNDYYFNEDGYLRTGWVEEDDGTRYYLNGAGERKTGWLDIDGEQYYLDDSGVLLTGWQTIDDTEYYFNEDGSLASGWVQIDDVTCYLDEDGSRHIGWLVENDVYYYMNEDGIMLTGWLNDGDSTYYFGTDGAMLTGMQSISDSFYFFDDTGAMQTGWITLSDDTYYFESSGKMCTGWKLIDDTAYCFGSDGVYDPDGGTVEEGTSIALTFEDGPSGYTSQILSVLTENNAAATFFMLGSQVSSYSDTVLAVYNSDCQIGIHSYDHTAFTSLTDEEITEQLKAARKAVKDITGKSPWLVRTPEGSCDDSMATLINKPVIIWSLDSADDAGQDVTTIVETVLNNVSAGSIIRMHDTSSTSAEAAEILIPTLTALGYDLVTVSRLASVCGESLENGSVYSSFS